MIYANDITTFDCTVPELEERLLFWMVVAGKGAHVMANKLESFLLNLWELYPGSGFQPFWFVRCAIQDGRLDEQLRRVGMGKYALLERGMREVVRLNPQTCTVAELEAVPGVGPKTARCFLLHSRPNQRLAGLDTHVLKWLSSMGHTVPKSTPTGRWYLHWEQVFLEYADAYGLAPADLDLRIWRFYAGRDAILDLTPLVREAA